jgi:beta-carotene 15,15'-dioxygenase
VRETTVHPERVGVTAAAATVSTAVAAAAVVAGVVAPGATAAAAPALFVAGFLVGLPHGAVDHLVPGWVGLTRGGPRTMVAILAAYLAAAVGAWTALTLAGPVAVLALLALSVLHFGLGDVMADPAVAPGLRGSSAAAAVLARGGAVVVLPVARWPAQTDRVLGALDPRVPALLGPGTRAALLGVLLGCALVAVVDALRRRRNRDAAEIAVLLALFAVVPPIAAFGVYFGGWHALRHTARLLAADPANADDLAAGHWRRPLGRFARAAAAPTAAVLTALAGLLLLAARPGLLVPVLTVLLALTVPHVVVVAVLDHAALRRAQTMPWCWRNRNVTMPGSTGSQ